MAFPQLNQGRAEAHPSEFEDAQKRISGQKQLSLAGLKRRLRDARTGRGAAFRFELAAGATHPIVWRSPECIRLDASGQFVVIF
jgi:hypothetical protein